MLSKLSLALFAGAFFIALSAANLFAQAAPADPTLTETDIKLFLDFANAASPEAQGKVLASSGKSPTEGPMIIGKITTIIGIRAAGLPAEQEKAALSSNPTFKFSDAELALIKAQEADLIAAYKKLTTPK
ncbi:MAG: hypothetical protein LBR11_10960 [Deltaproteobacteria bacterium]|jgi:hypothetical protein|nr:hypothetical protein [Deltaproteobacteria bacterium]